MPLRAVQIFVQCESAEALAAALDRALRRQKAPAVHERRLVALHTEGWAVLLEEGHADGGLARLLSELCGGRSLALELDGAGLSLRLREYASGEPGDVAEAKRFEDVEGRAWSVLRSLQVPPSLRLFALDEVELFEPGPELADGEGLFALEAFVSQAGVRIERRRAAPPERREGKEPPAAPDLMVESQAGEARAFEVRTLQGGPPSADELSLLAEVEEVQARRLASQLAATADEGRIARPGFVYQTAGGAPGLDEGLLGRARARRPWLQRLFDPDKPAPLSHAGFTALCHGALTREHPEARVLRAHALRLELASAAGGVSLRVPLAAAYADYLFDDRDDPEAHAAEVVASTRALCAAPLAPLSAWTQEELLAALLPTVIPATLAANGPAGRASDLFTLSLSSALLVDDGTRIAPVDQATLALLGISYDDALDRAVANSDARTLAAPEAISYFDLEQGRVLLCDFDDPGGAGRLLSPLARSLFLQILGGVCYAASPTRDSLLACSPEEPEALAWLIEESRRRFSEAPFPIHPGLVQVTEEGAFEVAGDQLEPVG